MAKEAPLTLKQWKALRNQRKKMIRQDEDRVRRMRLRQRLHGDPVTGQLERPSDRRKRKRAQARIHGTCSQVGCTNAAVFRVKDRHGAYNVCQGCGKRIAKDPEVRLVRR